MSKKPVSELNEELLTWFIAESEGKLRALNEGKVVELPQYRRWLLQSRWDPINDIKLVQALQTRGQIGVEPVGAQWRAHSRNVTAMGASIQLAVLRCHVAGIHGELVEIPEHIAPLEYEVTRFETANFQIEVNNVTLTGRYLHKKLGDLRSGDLYFTKVGDSLELHDYDGAFMLPPQVEECLAKHYPQRTTSPINPHKDPS